MSRIYGTKTLICTKIIVWLRGQAPYRGLTGAYRAHRASVIRKCGSLRITQAWGYNPDSTVLECWKYTVQRYHDREVPRLPRPFKVTHAQEVISGQHNGAPYRRIICDI
jgi:hypothetical protein